MSARHLGLIAAAAALALDQATKLLILYGLGAVHLAPGRAISVLPFFNLVMLWNPGISLGLFPANGPEQTVLLATFQFLAACAFLWWLWFVQSRWLGVSLGLVIGGALGNLIDRLIYGAVADFFHFYAFGYYFYVFNIADAAITFGILGWLYDALLNRQPTPGEIGKETNL
ncbi:MAG: signal peptidase II [Rhizomicrobium sp.]